MRLTCPNCDAQYEIADNVIPDEGRDVQCSNCGTTWFQESAKSEAEAARSAGFEPEPDAGPEPAGEEPAVGGAEEDASQADGDGDTDGVAEPDDLPGTTVSDESAAILKEEALRELKARLAEGSSLEQQDDLGLTEPAAEAPRARPVDPNPIPVPVPQPAPASSADAGVSRDSETSKAVAEIVSSNRDRLPDIEEINSTLTAASARRAITEDAEPVSGGDLRRTGFRIGFFAAVIVAVGGAVAYIFAPQIAESFPDAGPMLAAFVERTDGVRIWLDGWVAQTMQSLTSTMDAAVSDG